MTLLYIIHRQEQLDAARADFALVWAGVIGLRPDLDTPGNQVRGWIDFLKYRNLLNPQPRKHPPA